MVTLFKEDYGLDIEAMRSHVDFLVEGGVHGILVAGSTGEFTTLTGEERRRLAEAVVDQAGGRVPVYVGTGGTSTDEVIRLTRHAKDVGAAAAVVVTPYYFTLRPEVLYEHYRAVAEETGFPVVVYNFPAATGINLDPGVIARLSQTANIVGLKDSTENLAHMQAVIQLTQGRFPVIAGSDGLLLPLLMAGGRGSTTGSGNFLPQLPVGIYESFRKGDYEKARALHQRLMSVRRALALGRTPVASLKEALRLMGRPVSAVVRRPLLPLTEREREELKKIIEEVGLL